MQHDKLERGFVGKVRRRTDLAGGHQIRRAMLSFN
jgi:hypothetical protein